MVDTGASSNFVSRRMVDHLKLEYVRCPPGEEVLFRLANNTVYVSSLTAIVPIRIANTMHEELLNMRVIETASFAMIFGMPWLRRHCPRLHFDTLQVELSCLNNGRCFPVRFDDETEYYDASSTLGSSITSSSPVIISSNATIVDLPVQATMEPRADPFAGYPEHHPEELIELPPINVIHTEQPTVLPPIQLPPVDFNHALQQLQEQFVHEMHNQQAQLDEWIENNTWEQQDKWLQNANNDNWIAHKNHNWLQVIQPMLTQEDERSIYELQHSEEMINQQVIATIINLDTPPQSDHEEDNDGFEFIQEVINVDTPSATPPPPP